MKKSIKYKFTSRKRCIKHSKCLGTVGMDSENHVKRPRGLH